MLARGPLCVSFRSSLRAQRVWPRPFRTLLARFPSIFHIVSSYAGVRSWWRRRVEMLVEKIPVVFALVPFAAFAVIHLFFHQSHHLSLAVAPFFLFSV